MMATYFEGLLDLDLEAVTGAVAELLRECKFFPSLAEWRAAAEEVQYRREDRKALPASTQLGQDEVCCSVCDDSGWAPYEHPTTGHRFVRRCSCVSNNPVIAAKREAERRAGRAKRRRD